MKWKAIAPAAKSANENGLESMRAAREFEEDLAARGLLEEAKRCTSGLGVRVADLSCRGSGQAKASEVTLEARARFARVLLNDFRWAFADVARLLGYRSHSSVMALTGAANTSERFRRVAREREAKFAGVGVQASDVDRIGK